MDTVQQPCLPILRTAYQTCQRIKEEHYTIIRCTDFLGGQTVFTGGLEYVHDAVLDEITAYNDLMKPNH